jgi:alanyl-tRNA synthetase
MTASEVRKSFIDYFKNKKHSIVKSAPVVPADDPTLLFTNAGMNQFKDIFLGKGTRDYSRAVNSQKCIRVSGKHNDLEEVGHDTYHHTFFEMLGNWSFGDYYKKEAIEWAWELLTDVWKLPKEKLYATVFREDDEAAKLWEKVTDVPKERILRFDEKDNFWEMGDTGPCGPCSEIHYDQGPEMCDKKGQEHVCFVNGDCGRYIELWNLVFIQYDRDVKGKLNPLPSKHVDTGAGFERLVAVLQGKNSNYDTDVFQPLLDRIGELVGVPYEKSQEQMAYRVIADHVRMLTFSIADGGFPSNEGRGYVMRRILRRASRYARKLDIHDPFIYQLVDKVVELMGETYPEISERARHVAGIIRSEEEHFNRNLDRGIDIFEKIVMQLAKEKKSVIPGTEVFRLYDTYGFPPDLTRIMANERGFDIDLAGYENEMAKQKDLARESAKFKSGDIDPDAWQVLAQDKPTVFAGYEKDTVDTKIIKYAEQGDQLHMILAETPFYAESGGQVGDSGTITVDGQTLIVTDTQKSGDQIIHICRKSDSFVVTENKVVAEINAGNRRETEKNHSATHLLHAALRTVLGDHVQQAGSLVAPDRLRFDFTHHEKPDESQLLEIEDIVNKKIQQDVPLMIDNESFDDAKARGAMALFGEKYDDVVRTIQIDDFSLELCGGTHVKQTGVIGPFIIIYEGSIASGVRRIEAISGLGAVKYMQSSRNNLQKISELLNASDDNLVEKTQDLIEKKRQADKEIQKLNSKLAGEGIDSILTNSEQVGDINLLIHEVEGVDMPQLKELGDHIRDGAKNTVALLGSNTGQKISFVCVVTDDLVKSGKYNAGDIVRKVAGVAGGGGGGRPHMATAGGKDVSKFHDAMQSIKELI